MAFDILIILNLVALLYIWFDTDAVVEWAALLRLKFFKYEQYEKNKQSPVPIIAKQTYCEFLAYTYGFKSFIIRAITCPICFTVWANVALLGVFLCKMQVLMLGPNIIMSWVAYHTLRWILKKTNE